MKAILRRTFKGPNDSVLTSVYMPSKLYAVIAFIPASAERLATIDTSIFRTKKEAQEYLPIVGGRAFDTNDEAIEYYNSTTNQNHTTTAK